MKKLLVVMIMCGLVMTALHKEVRAQDAITQVIKEGVKKVIKAVDLKIQRLQTKTIWLQNAQKVLENKMSKLKLDEIGGWVQKQHDLYANYYKELWQVKDGIATYGRVKQLIQDQLKLVEAYKRAYKLFRQDKHFTGEELDYMLEVYNNIISESIKNLDLVYSAITSFDLQMSDEKRLEIIDEAAGKIEMNYYDLKAFNNQNMLLSLQRARDENDLEVVKQLYGIEN